jgi:quinol monooxygenase YgiN
VFIVHVDVHVKPEFIDAFREATLENARNSVQEPGIARFDVVQQLDDQSRFVLVEVYRSSQDPAGHKKTAYYQTWRDTVAEMMAEMPARQVLLDGCIQVEYPLLHQFHDTPCAHRFGNRSSLEYRLRRGRGTSLLVCQTIHL